MSAGRVRDDSRKDPEQLKREAAAARADVGETLDELQARMSPGQLVDQALGYVRSGGGDFVRNLGDHARNNPMAVMLTAVGLAWLMASQGRASRGAAPYQHAEAILEGNGETAGAGGAGKLRAAASGARERAAEVREGMRERAGHVRDRAGQMRERVSGAAGAVTQRVGSVAGGARDQAYRAREGFGRMMEEQPLVVGALGIALGAALGALLPATAREDELLGEARDRMLDRAREAGAEQYERVRETTKRAAEGARQAARSDDGRQGEPATGTVAGTETPPPFAGP